MENKMREVKKLPATLYALYYYNDSKGDGITDKDIKALEDALRYYQKKNPFMSWFVAVSETDSDTAFKYNDKQGRRGRPKTKVDGVKVKRHIHVGIIGDSENPAWTVAKKVSESTNKRKKRKNTKLEPKTATFITYSYKQAKQFHTGGDFDFRQFKDGFYA